MTNADSFELDRRVVELWRRLSEPLETVEDLIDKLNTDPSVEIFTELETDMSEQPTVVNIDLFQAIQAKFYGEKIPEKCPINRFINCTAENIYQHADDPDLPRKSLRGLRTQSPYARCVLVVQFLPQEYFDMYMLDNGIGFKHPVTGENTIRDAVRHGWGFGKHHGDGLGLSTALGVVDKSTIISAGKYFQKYTSQEILMDETKIAEDLARVQGALVFGRVEYRPAMNYALY